MDELEASSRQSAVKAHEAVEGGKEDKRRLAEQDALLSELRQAIDGAAEREAAALAEALETAKMEAQKSRAL